MRGPRGARRLRYDEIATECQGRWILVAKPGELGPVFWPAWAATASPEDKRNAVDWDEGTRMLQENGLTIAIDRAGYAHIRYRDGDARKAARENRRRVRLDRAAAAWRPA